MMKLKISLLGTLICFAGLAKAQNVSTSTQTLTIKSQVDSVSYAIGAGVARDLKSRGVQELSYSLIIQAMQDVFAGKPSALSLQQGQQCIMDYLTYVKKKTAEPLIAEAKRFLEENKKKKGVITTASGLQYEVIKAVKGTTRPKTTDEVTVHYRGKLTNGKQFDSSYDRNQPATFALNQVIPGWTEGLQLMTEGSTYRFYIPYQLGYGENGAGNDIPAYSVLIFDVELIKIGK